MSADWFFMRHGYFFSHKKIGPICERELLVRIDKGEIHPETLMSSTSKTHGHWLPMRDIKPAMQHWRERHSDVT